MDQEIVMALGVGALVAFFVVLFVITNRVRKNQRDALQAFADRHGLDVDHGTFPMLRGELDGRAFMMGYERLHNPGSGRRVRGARMARLFLVRLKLNGALPEGLVVTNRGLLQKAMQSDVHTGDAAFDRKAFVQSSDASAATTYLTPARRAAILELLPKKIELVDGELAYGPRTGKNPTLEYLEQTSKPFRDAAPILDADSDAVLRAPLELSMQTDAPRGRTNPHVAAGVWMGVTALLLQYVPAVFSSQIEARFSIYVVWTVLAVAGAAYGASRVFEGRIEHHAWKGAAIGAASWLVGTLVISLFTWGPFAQFSSWSSMTGLIAVALSAASGVLMELSGITGRQQRS